MAACGRKGEKHAALSSPRKAARPELEAQGRERGAPTSSGGHLARRYARTTKHKSKAMAAEGVLPASNDQRFETSKAKSQDAERAVHYF